MCERVSSGPPWSQPLQLTVPKNYKVWCAMNNIPVDESIIENGAADDDDDQMDVDAGAETNADEEWGGLGDDDAAMDEDDGTPAFFKELKAANEASATQKTPSKRPKNKGRSRGTGEDPEGARGRHWFGGEEESVCYAINNPEMNTPGFSNNIVGCSIKMTI